MRRRRAWMRVRDFGGAAARTVSEDHRPPPPTRADDSRAAVPRHRGQNAAEPRGGVAVGAGRRRARRRHPTQASTAYSARRAWTPRPPACPSGRAHGAAWIVAPLVDLWLDKRRRLHARMRAVPEGWPPALAMPRRRRAAPVTAKAGAGARSGRGLDRGRAWAAARRGRARAGARGRATAGGWAGWDAARPRLCTPPRSWGRSRRAGPWKPGSTDPPTRSIPSGPSPRSASGGGRWRHRFRGRDVEAARSSGTHRTTTRRAGGQPGSLDGTGSVSRRCPPMKWTCRSGPICVNSMPVAGLST